MKLFLTSAGLKNKTLAKALLDMVGKPAGEINITFIPTAISFRKDVFARTVLAQGKKYSK